MVEVKNFTSRKIDGKILKRVAKEVLENEKKKMDLEIILVGPNSMRKLNRTFGKKNRITDVLSFPLEKGYGQIFLCPKLIKKNAILYKNSFEKELTLCLIHGILHLLKYDHQKEKERKLMKEKERKYLLKFYG